MDVLSRSLLYCLFMVIRSEGQPSESAIVVMQPAVVTVSGLAVNNVQEVRLYPCGDAGYREVVENSTMTFTCDQYTGSVAWKYTDLQIGTCPEWGSQAAACSQDYTEYWTLNYTSNTSSELTTSFIQRGRPAGAVYRCINGRQVAKCGLHVIVPAEVSQPTAADITEDDSGYTVHVTAAITKVYSSRGLYLCVWQVGSLSLTTTPDLDSPANDTDNTADRSGSCDVTVTLPSNTWDRTCGLKVIPGNTHRPCGNNTIDTNVTNVIFYETTTTTTTATSPLDTTEPATSEPDVPISGSLALTSGLLMTVTLVTSQIM